MYNEPTQKTKITTYPIFQQSHYHLLEYLFILLSCSVLNKKLITMSTETFFVPVELPQQKHYNNDITFPAVLSPNPEILSQNKPSFCSAIKSSSSALERLLSEAGAILFRGFPVLSASDFNDVVEAFGFLELPYVGGAAPRSNVVGRVFTANESPPDQKIPFHHEMAQVQHTYRAY